MQSDPPTQGPFGKTPGANGTGAITPDPPSPADPLLSKPPASAQALPSAPSSPTEPKPPTSTADQPKDQQPKTTQIAGIDVIKDPTSQSGGTDSTGHTLRRWKCSKCGTLIESFNEVIQCSKCGAGPESLVDVE